MKVTTNNHELTVSSVVSTTIKKNGKSYPALKFVFDGAITEADIAALTSGEFTIDDNPHEGYNTLGEISVIVGKITTAEEERDELATALAAEQQKNAELTEALNVVVGGSAE